MRAAHAEIDEHLARRRQHHARGLGGDQRLKMQDVDQPRFGELCLRHRRGDAQDRFIGEKHRALGHGVHVAGEAKRGEIIEQVLAESPGALEPGDLRRVKAQILEEIERLLQSGGEEKTAAGRKVTEEKLKHSGVRRPGVQVRLHHVELVKVGQQRAGTPRLHHRRLSFAGLST